MPRTLYEKIWDEHVVRAAEGEPSLLYIDLHLVHEVTSPQAFDGLRAAGRGVRRPELTFATLDHNIPTTPNHFPITDTIAQRQIDGGNQPCNGLTDHASPERSPSVPSGASARKEDCICWYAAGSSIVT